MQLMQRLLASLSLSMYLSTTGLMAVELLLKLHPHLFFFEPVSEMEHVFEYYMTMTLTLNKGLYSYFTLTGSMNNAHLFLATP